MILSMENIELILVYADKYMHVRDLNEDYHCQFGVISKNQLKKAKNGGSVKSNSGFQMHAFRPGFMDLYRKIKRTPQIIPLKDIGVILAETGIGSKSTVVDAGTGSGALALFMANVAKKVVSYEIREDFAAIAAENAKFLKLKNLKIKNVDVCKGIEEKNVDAVLLDLAEPWKVTETAAAAIRIGGHLVSYSPTTPQVSDFITSLKNNSFLHVKTIESIQREWEFNERVVRPKSQPIGHSGFITFARKVR